MTLKQTLKTLRSLYNPFFTMAKTHKIFMSKKQAINWVAKHVEDSCVDNYRFTYLSDEKGIQKYAKALKDGCCGYYDAVIRVGLKRAVVGCNYGH